ncbi:hypothetical protein [Natrarchaeobius chitinivorans]|uniref:hypothetical protein n=1 Tax=Natrarchaeobius chitinivorans TaxID=1679083 RepID=UPI001FB4B3BB|nr:hypothetical protein [Natrarchaeobius chitinivorans]
MNVVESVYEASNGRYYTDWQLHRRLESGRWRRCLSQRDPDRRLVEADGGELLFLTPVDPEELPNWTEIRIERRAAHVVETRQPLCGPR